MSAEPALANVAVVWLAFSCNVTLFQVSPPLFTPVLEGSNWKDSPPPIHIFSVPHELLLAALLPTGDRGYV